MVAPWKFSLDRRICSASFMRSVRSGTPSRRWRMLNQSITADVGQRFGSIAIEVSISGAAWPDRDSARHLLFQTAIGIAFHVLNDAAEAIGQTGTEQQRDAAQPSNRIGRPFHRHSQLLFNLAERGLEHPHGHRRHDALFDPDAIAD